MKREIKQKQDIGKIIYDLTESKFGEYRTVCDYSIKLPKVEELSEEECKSSNKFISYKIFVKDIVGNCSEFWSCLSNFNIAYNRKEVEEHFNKRIKQLEEELELWKKFKEIKLKKADIYIYILQSSKKLRKALTILIINYMTTQELFNQLPDKLPPRAKTFDEDYVYELEITKHKDDCIISYRAYGNEGCYISISEPTLKDAITSMLNYLNKYKLI